MKDSYFSFGWFWGVVITGVAVWAFGFGGFLSSFLAALFVLCKDLWEEAEDEDLS